MGRGGNVGEMGLGEMGGNGSAGGNAGEMGQPELRDFSFAIPRFKAVWEMGQPELRNFSASHVRSANSASWLVGFAAGAAARSFLGRPRAQCRPNCSEIALTNSSSPNGRHA